MAKEDEAHSVGVAAVGRRSGERPPPAPFMPGAGGEGEGGDGVRRLSERPGICRLLIAIRALPVGQFLAAQLPPLSRG